MAAAAPILSPSHAAAANRNDDPVVKAVRQAKLSVVSIHGRKTVRGETPASGENANGRQVNGMGTGIVLDPRGYIITNYHVVDGVANIQVALHDHRDTIARLVAHDPKTDLAVIKVDLPEAMQPLTFGTSCDLLEAEHVIAIGNAYGYNGTVTDGRISALHRTVQVSDEQKYHDLIQTSAPINPGNSGGPLLNDDGHVIGINVAVRVGAQNIAFAIPIDEALEVAARLMSIERLDKNMHGILGATEYKPEQRKFIVSNVRKESPGDKAGLQTGDIVKTIADQKVERALDVELALLGKKPGDEMPVEVERGGAAVSLTMAVSPLARSGAKLALQDRVWSSLGLKLAPMNEAEFKRLNSRYRGGLRVLDVRKDSPADKQGIRQSDVLVGMHVWETISLDNMAYILDREDVAKTEPVVFYIVRGTDTLFGHLRLAERTTP